MQLFFTKNKKIALNDTKKGAIAIAPFFVNNYEK